MVYQVYPRRSNSKVEKYSTKKRFNDDGKKRIK